jgi:hypothetical protein
VFPAKDVEAGENPARSRHCNRSPAERATESQTHPRLDAIQLVAKTREPKPMSDTTSHTGGDVVAAPIPVRAVLPWAIFGLLMLLLIYFVGAEEGATSIFRGMYIHEFLHDGRHLLGFPCH